MEQNRLSGLCYRLWIFWESFSLIGILLSQTILSLSPLPVAYVPEYRYPPLPGSGMLKGKTVTSITQRSEYTSNFSDQFNFIRR